MNAKWGWLTPLAMVLVVLVLGCKTQPDLKPASQPEVFNPPPTSASLASYPKQAFVNPDDANRRQGLDPGGVGKSPTTMPASFGGPSGMSGGMR
jgi:hypothetical protein